MQCRRLSPGEIRHTAGQTTKLSRHNGSKITRYIFRKPVPDINLTGIHPAMYKKLMAFFNLTAALDSYDSVYILANSAGGWSEQICLKENDLVIAFNHHPRYLIDCDKCDLVVLQRQYSDSELYQGYHQDLSFRQHKIFYGIILKEGAI